MLGGFGDAKPADDEVKKVVKETKADVEKKLGATFNVLFSCSDLDISKNLSSLSILSLEQRMASSSSFRKFLNHSYCSRICLGFYNKSSHKKHPILSECQRILGHLHRESLFSGEFQHIQS